MCCYLRYEDDLLCAKGDSGRYRYIKEGELMELLNLKRAEYFNTKKALIDNNLIHIDSEYNIHINKYISCVGSIPKKNRREYTRMFKDGIKYLYLNATAKEHKKLALFVELLPYIHYNYNIICVNPSCELMDNVEPLTISNIVEMFPIDKNKSRLKKQLLNTTVAGEKLMIMVTDNNKEYFLVNPRLYYKGNKLDDLNYLSNLFRV